MLHVHCPWVGQRQRLGFSRHAAPWPFIAGPLNSRVPQELFDVSCAQPSVLDCITIWKLELLNRRSTARGAWVTRLRLNALSFMGRLRRQAVGMHSAAGRCWVGSKEGVSISAGLFRRYEMVLGVGPGLAFRLCESGSECRMLVGAPQSTVDHSWPQLRVELR